MAKAGYRVWSSPIQGSCPNGHSLQYRRCLCRPYCSRKEVWWNMWRKLPIPAVPILAMRPSGGTTSRWTGLISTWWYHSFSRGKGFRGEYSSPILSSSSLPLGSRKRIDSNRRIGLPWHGNNRVHCHTVLRFLADNMPSDRYLPNYWSEEVVRGIRWSVRDTTRFRMMQISRLIDRT